MYSSSRRLQENTSQKYGCQIESWGPFAEGKNGLFTNPVLTEIGKKYEKTAAQTALRFLLQSDVVVIPKSVHKERMKQNIDVFDFTLTAEDMAALKHWMAVRAYSSPTMIQRQLSGSCLFYKEFGRGVTKMVVRNRKICL